MSDTSLGKVLSKSGLQYFWTKLKAILDGKSDTGHSHEAATTSAPGFMSATDKTKLDNLKSSFVAIYDVTNASDIETAYQNGQDIFVKKDGYLLPMTYKLDDTVFYFTGCFTDALAEIIVDGSTWSISENLYRPEEHGHANATTSKAGFMSAADKVKLNGMSPGSSVVRRTVTLAAASWTSDADTGAFVQTVTITDGTANSLIALQPTVAQIAEIQGAGCTALMINNDNGVFTAFAVGAAPASDLTLQISITETV